MDEHELHGIHWRVTNGASLTSGNRIEFSEEETSVERAKLKCFTVLNFLRIIKDDFVQMGDV